MSAPASSTRKLKDEITKAAKAEAARTARKVAKNVALNTALDDEFNADNIDDNGEELEENSPPADSSSSSLSTLFDTPRSPFSAQTHIPEYEEDDRDVFEIGNEKMSKEGRTVKYFIKRNGQFATTAMAPYTIEQLQADLGGGVYSVDCRDGDNGQLITRKKFSVASPIANNAKVEREREAQNANLEIITNTFAQQQSNSLETFKEMTERILNEKRRDEEERQKREEADKQVRKEYEERLRMEARENQTSMTQLLATILARPVEKPVDNTTQIMTMFQQLQQSQAQQMTLMMTQMTAAIDKVSTSTNHAIEKVAENTRHMVDSLSSKLENIEKNKKPSITDDPLTFFEFLDGIKTREYDRGKEIGEALASADQPPKEKSIIETAVESLGKVMPALIMSQQGIGGVPPVQAPIQQTVIPAQTQQRPSAIPAPQPKQTLRKAAPIPAQGAPVARASVVATPKVAETQASATIVDKSPIVVNVCKAVIGKGIMSQTQPQTVAEEAATLLNQHGVTVDEALSLVRSVDELYSTALNFGLPLNDPNHGPLLREYLKGFYDNLSQFATSKPGQNS